MVRMIRALLLIAGVISMPAQSATSGGFYRTTGALNCSAGITFASEEPVPLSRFEEATRREVEQLPLYKSIKSLSCPSSGWPVHCTGQVNIIQTNGLPAVWNFSCPWERVSPLECSAGMHISVWDGKCIPDCVEGQEEDANGQCKPKEEGDCAAISMRPDQSGQCKSRIACSDPELMRYDSVGLPPCGDGDGSGGDGGGDDSGSGDSGDGGEESGECGGQTCGGGSSSGGGTGDGSGSGSGGGTGNGSGSGSDGGAGDGSGGDGDGSGGTGGSGGDGNGSGGTGGDGDDDMADIPPDDEFNSGDYDVLKPDEGTVRGWMQSAVNSLGLGPGGQCGNAQLESSIFGYPVNLNFVSFCTAIAPIINWFFWILVAYSVINTAMHLSGARTFSDSDRKAA